MTEEQINKLPKKRRDWLEIHGNQWAPVKVMPGTCEACVWGQGEHTLACCWQRGYEGLRPLAYGYVEHSCKVIG